MGSKSQGSNSFSGSFHNPCNHCSLTVSNHSGIRYKCEQCEKEFTTKNRLNLHLKHFHENIKDNKCAKCKKSFVISSGLKVHMERGRCKTK